MRRDAQSRAVRGHGCGLRPRHPRSRIAPRVALLNIGSEDQKGHRRDPRGGGRAACPDASAAGTFTGFVEGDKLARGDHDVIVCDGFAGKHRVEDRRGHCAIRCRSAQACILQLGALEDRLPDLAARPRELLRRSPRSQQSQRRGLPRAGRYRPQKPWQRPMRLGVATAIGNAAKLVRADFTRRIAEDLANVDQVNGGAGGMIRSGRHRARARHCRPAASPTPN